MMTWKGCEKNLSGMTYGYLGVCVEGLRKTFQNV
jgi:hypothetical protein